MRQLIKLPAPSSNGNTGLQEINTELGWEYYKLFGVKTAGTPAITDFSNIQPMVNNEAIWDNIDGQDLDEINKADGLTPYSTNSVLMINFESQKFIDGVPRMATTINTGVKSPKTGKIITNFGLKYTLGAAGAFDWWAEVEKSDPAGPGYIQRLEKKGDNTLIGVKQFDSLPYGEADVNHAQWRRIFMKVGAGNILTAALKLGSRYLMEPTLKAVMDQLLLDGGKTPGAYFDYTMDFTRYNMPEYLTVLGIAAKSLKLELNTDTATSVNFIVNSLGEI